MKQDTQQTGSIGEKLAFRFLQERGFKIIETNYWRKWGEIDIVAEKDNILHFVEVKATVSPETSGYRPEENIRLWKKQRMSRAIKTYLSDRHISDEKEFLIDVVTMTLVFLNKKVKMRWVQNVILED